MTKLTDKEHATFRMAERHLIDAFGGARCLWEIRKSKTTPSYAAIAGFRISHRTAKGDFGHVVILVVYEGGSGWEIFGSPDTNNTGRTFDALKDMWSSTR